MSTSESFPPSTDYSDEQAITIQPTGLATYSGGNDWMPPGEGDASQSGLSAAALLHSLRRHWLVIFATGVAAAAVAGTLVFFVQKPMYKAEATLRTELKTPQILKEGAADADPIGDFEVFRETQRQLLRHRFVLNVALRNPKMKTLSSIQREDARHNALAWLQSVVQVDLIKGSGIMQVSATLPDANEAATIVNAVVEAYMEEVVNRDRLQRRERLDSLQHIAGEKEAEVRTKREQLKRELEQIGVSDDQQASMRGQMAMSTCLEYQRELQKMKWERTALSGKLEECKSLREALTATLNPLEIPRTEIVAVLNTNPDYHDIVVRERYLEQFLNAQKAAVKGVKPGSTFSRASDELTNAKTQKKEMEDDAEKQVRDAKRIELDREIRRLTYELELATNQVAAFQKETDAKQRDADNVGHSTVTATMQRADLESVERILHGVSEERERLRVELNSSPRVSIVGDRSSPAAVPENETGGVARYLFIAVASFLALVLPGISIVVWDVRKLRINSASEVTKRLRLSVMGTLPFIPASVMRRLGSASRKSQIWKMRYTEAVDGVVGRLLRNAECEQARVILVTSAMSGEGKTWLATQIAMGLARAQRRTVLVDFDLRQPALDGALGLPLGPGVCEALRGQSDIVQAVQSTETDCLSVVTAGNWNRQVLSALASGSVSAILGQLREKFEFVIIDSSPLLPIVDTRLVAQHVDAVLLSVLRDVSEGGKVEAAKEMLEAFGVSKVDAVVTASEQFGSAKTLLYQAALVNEEQNRLADEHLAPTTDKPHEENQTSRGDFKNG